MGWILRLPIDRHYPPASAVIEQLEAVDAACKWLFTLGVARLIGAEHMSNVVPGFNAVGHGILKKAVFAERSLAPGHVVVRRKNPRGYRALVIAAAGNQSCSGIEETAESIPVARACRA